MFSAAHGRELARVSIARSCPKISHLFFVDDSLIFLKATAMEFGFFRTIMRAYERASGQCLNYAKSMMCFSPNVKQDTRMYFHSILHMQVVDHLGSYLGLPSSFSRGKGKDFQFLLDRIWSTLLGWKGKLFSKGGKEILIKSVAQAIPT